jgi:hypothetical protein
MNINVFEILTIISSLAVLLVGVGAYCQSIIKKEVKPNLATWAVWAISSLTAFAVAVVGGKYSIGLVPVFMGGFGPLCILIFSLYKRQFYLKVQKLEWVCFVAAFVGVIISYYIQSFEFVLFVSMLVDFIGSFPTLYKLKTDKKESEPYLTYALYLPMTIFGILALPQITFLSSGYQFYLFFLNALIICFSYRNKLNNKPILTTV